MADVLVKGGEVVDGTGAAPFRADVRVRSGRIVEVAPGLMADGEPIIDAAGAFVAPGIIDTHTHLDGAMWWDPDLDPLPAQGNTSMIFGNCGNSIAPLAGPQRDEVVDLLCFLEDLPLRGFPARAAVELGGLAVVRHRPFRRSRQRCTSAATSVTSSLRTFVMGAAAWQRAATADEIRRMCDRRSTNR